MKSENRIEDLLTVLKANLRMIKDPSVELSKAVEILEESAGLFASLIEKLEVEEAGDKGFQDSFKD